MNHQKLFQENIFLLKFQEKIFTSVLKILLIKYLSMEYVLIKICFLNFFKFVF